MATNQNCAVNASTADLFVTALGKVVRRGACLPCGSLDLGTLAREKGFDGDRDGKEDAEARRRHKAKQEAWERLLREQLTKREYFKLVSGFQENVDFGRFRVYGELRNGRPRVVVVTEFQQFCDNDDFWTRLNVAAKRLKARVWVMSEKQHVDHSWRITQSGKKYAERFGPDHGRKERQVELSWCIETLTTRHLRAFVKKIADATSDIWKEGGVGVC
jgi:hypothetical protein